jgi:hypothetical protein
MTGKEYLYIAIRDHGFKPEEGELANTPYNEFDGFTLNEYNAMRLVTHNAYEAPKL